MSTPPHITAVPWPLAAVAAALAVAAVVAVGVAVRRMVRATDAQTVLTVAVAAIATGASAAGMWRVFGDALDAGPVGRVAGFAVLELALAASAIRARASLRDTGSVGVDGVAVWVIASLSGVASAWDQDGALGKMVRLSLPLLAAWLWERGLAADRRRARERRPAQVSWRLTRERVAVRLGLADPSDRAVTDVARARRLARLTRARLRLAVLEQASQPRWLAGLHRLRVARARHHLTRLALSAVEHLDLGQDRGAADSIRATVAAVVGLPAATDPAALAATTPWATSAGRQPRPAAAIAPPQVPATTATPDASGDTTPPPAGDTAPPLAATGPVAAATHVRVADMSVSDQINWFARHLPRHPGRSTAEWMAETGLTERTTQRRVAAATALLDRRRKAL